MMRKSVFITGGAGYLGARVAARLLDDGVEVHIPVREATDLTYLSDVGAAGRVQLHKLNPDLQNLTRIIVGIRPTVAIHLAAKSRGGESDAEISEYVSSNLLFPSLVVNGLRKAGTDCFVNCGTSWQWGEHGDYRPFNFYAATKEAFEALLAHYLHDGMRAITLRLFDVYGVGDKRSKVVDLLAKAAASGTSLGMTAGEQQIDLVHVDDASEAIRLAVHQVQELVAGQSRVYGVSGAERITVKQLAALVGEIVGRAPPVEWGDRPYRAREIMKPYSGFAIMPGWSPARSLRDGIQELVELGYRT